MSTLNFSSTSSTRLLAIGARCPAAMQQRSTWSLKEFSLVSEVGSGAASVVWYAVCRRSLCPVALKMYHKKLLSPLNSHQVEREVLIHSTLAHPHIVDFYAAFEDEERVYLVLEYAAGGDLFDNVKRLGGRLSEQQVVHAVMYPYLSALAYLHARGVVHRDLKPENTVFQVRTSSTGVQEKVLKITDFGLAINIRQERPVTRLGTLDFMSPEVLRCPDKLHPSDNKDRPDLAYGPACDVWAVGALAYELCVGRAPFGMSSREATMQAITSLQPGLPEWISPAAADFICASLTKDPAARASLDSLLFHPWVMPAAAAAAAAAATSCTSTCTPQSATGATTAAAAKQAVMAQYGLGQGRSQGLASWGSRSGHLVTAATQPLKVPGSSHPSKLRTSTAPLAPGAARQGQQGRQAGGVLLQGPCNSMPAAAAAAWGGQVEGVDVKGQGTQGVAVHGQAGGVWGVSPVSCSSRPAATGFMLTRPTDLGRCIQAWDGTQHILHPASDQQPLTAGNPLGAMAQPAGGVEGDLAALHSLWQQQGPDALVPTECPQEAELLLRYWQQQQQQQLQHEQWLRQAQQQQQEHKQQQLLRIPLLQQAKQQQYLQQQRYQQQHQQHQPKLEQLLPMPDLLPSPHPQYEEQACHPLSPHSCMEPHGHAASTLTSTPTAGTTMSVMDLSLDLSLPFPAASACLSASPFATNPRQAATPSPNPSPSLLPSASLADPTAPKAVHIAALRRAVTSYVLGTASQPRPGSPASPAPSSAHARPPFTANPPDMAGWAHPLPDLPGWALADCPSQTTPPQAQGLGCTSSLPAPSLGAGFDPVAALPSVFGLVQLQGRQDQQGQQQQQQGQQQRQQGQQQQQQGQQQQQQGQQQQQQHQGQQQGQQQQQQQQGQTAFPPYIQQQQQQQQQQLQNMMQQHQHLKQQQHQHLQHTQQLQQRSATAQAWMRADSLPSTPLEPTARRRPPGPGSGRLQAPSTPCHPALLSGPSLPQQHWRHPAPSDLTAACCSSQLAGSSIDLFSALLGDTNPPLPLTGGQAPCDDLPVPHHGMGASAAAVPHSDPDNTSSLSPMPLLQLAPPHTHITATPSATPTQTWTHTPTASNHQLPSTCQHHAGTPYDPSPSHLPLPPPSKTTSDTGPAPPQPHVPPPTTTSSGSSSGSSVASRSAGPTAWTTNGSTTWPTTITTQPEQEGGHSWVTPSPVPGLNLAGSRAELRSASAASTPRAGGRGREPGTRQGGGQGAGAGRRHQALLRTMQSHHSITSHPSGGLDHASLLSALGQLTTLGSPTATSSATAAGSSRNVFAWSGPAPSPLAPSAPAPGQHSGGQAWVPSSPAAAPSFLTPPSAPGSHEQQHRDAGSGMGDGAAGAKAGAARGGGAGGLQAAASSRRSVARNGSGQLASKRRTPDDCSAGTDELPAARSPLHPSARQHSALSLGPRPATPSAPAPGLGASHRNQGFAAAAAQPWPGALDSLPAAAAAGEVEQLVKVHRSNTLMLRTASASPCCQARESSAGWQLAARGQAGIQLAGSCKAGGVQDPSPLPSAPQLQLPLLELSPATGHFDAAQAAALSATGHGHTPQRMKAGPWAGADFAFAAGAVASQAAAGAHPPEHNAPPTSSACRGLPTPLMLDRAAAGAHGAGAGMSWAVEGGGDDAMDCQEDVTVATSSGWGPDALLQQQPPPQAGRQHRSATAPAAAAATAAAPPDHHDTLPSRAAATQPGTAHAAPAPAATVAATASPEGHGCLAATDLHTWAHQPLASSLPPTACSPSPPPSSPPGPQGGGASPSFNKGLPGEGTGHPPVQTLPATPPIARSSSSSSDGGSSGHAPSCRRPRSKLGLAGGGAGAGAVDGPGGVENTALPRAGLLAAAAAAAAGPLLSLSGPQGGHLAGLASSVSHQGRATGALDSYSQAAMPNAVWAAGLVGGSGVVAHVLGMEGVTRSSLPDKAATWSPPAQEHQLQG